jgi:formylglycine-generating enzyme required for sulfatase activity
MRGNVREWCWDWRYKKLGVRGDLVDPFGPATGIGREHRGGDWSSKAWYCRSADRASNPPERSGERLGFRLAMTIDTSTLKPAQTQPTKRDEPPPAVAPFDAVQAKAHQAAWAKSLSVPVEKTVDLSGGAKMTFMLILPGEFMMGSSPKDQARFVSEAKATKYKVKKFKKLQIPSEGPQHRVRITRPFYLGKYEVTQGQWQAVMGDNPPHSTRARPIRSSRSAGTTHSFC